MTPAAMILTILGSGTCVPSLQRSSCAVLVRGPDFKALFDIGPGTMRRLLEAGTEIFDLEYLFLSHFHPDHSGELASFFFSNKYGGQDRQKKKLTLCGGRGLKRFWEGLYQVYGHWITWEPDLLQILEMNTAGPDEKRFAAFTIRTLPAAHNPESIHLRLTDHRGRSVVYSGDTDYSENLIILADKADLLICEASHPDNAKTDGHLTPALAGEIATRAGVRGLVLTHFYPECGETDMAAQCREAYDGPLYLAQDLMQIQV